MAAERDLTQHENLDRVDRERWCRAIAYTYRIFPAEVIHAIVAGGKAEFIRIARQEYANHCLHYEDFERIFELITARSERLKAKDVLVGGGEQLNVH